jgi:hypothetical protein
VAGPRLISFWGMGEIIIKKINKYKTQAVINTISFFPSSPVHLRDRFLNCSQFGTCLKWDSIEKNQRVHGIRIFAIVSGFVFLEISILVSPLFHHAVSRQMSGSIHTHCQIYIGKPQIPPSFNNTALSPGLISGKT